MAQFWNCPLFGQIVKTCQKWLKPVEKAKSMVLQTWWGKPTKTDFFFLIDSSFAHHHHVVVVVTNFGLSFKTLCNGRGVR